MTRRGLVVVVICAFSFGCGNLLASNGDDIDPVPPTDDAAMNADDGGPRVEAGGDVSFCRKSSGPSTVLCADFDEVGRPVEDYFTLRFGTVDKDSSALSAPASARAVRLGGDSYLEKAFQESAAEWTIAFAIRPDAPATFAVPMRFESFAADACTMAMELLADGRTQLRVSSTSADGGGSARAIELKRTVARGQWNRVELVVTTTSSQILVAANVDGVAATDSPVDTGCKLPKLSPRLRLGLFNAMVGYETRFDDVIVKRVP